MSSLELPRVEPPSHCLTVYSKSIKIIIGLSNSMLRIHTKPTKVTQNWTEIDKNFQCALLILDF